MDRSRRGPGWRANWSRIPGLPAARESKTPGSGRADRTWPAGLDRTATVADTGAPAFGADRE